VRPLVVGQHVLPAGSHRRYWREGRNRTNCLGRCRSSPSYLRRSLSSRFPRHGPDDRSMDRPVHYPSARPRASLSRAKARDSGAAGTPPAAPTRQRLVSREAETGGYPPSTGIGRLLGG
jgi:hypothetical protein